MHLWGDFLKDFSLESNMKNVVKYCVYLDILFMGSIYVQGVVKSAFLRENPISGQLFF